MLLLSAFASFLSFLLPVSTNGLWSSVQSLITFVHLILSLPQSFSIHCHLRSVIFFFILPLNLQPHSVIHIVYLMAISCYILDPKCLYLFGRFSPMLALLPLLFSCSFLGWRVLVLIESWLNVF